MDIISTQKYIHTSPRKMRLVVDMIKKMRPATSLNTLRFTSKAAAKDLQDVINTAIANAKQGGLDLEKVYFKKIEVNEGPVMKRFKPASKGRALPFKRRMSHVKIVLSDEAKETK